jgi:S-adenosylmethionine:tRNA ribosyltransferase-isomerase
MLISDFDYNLPENLIAQAPLGKRENSRMLIVDRRNGELVDRNFYDLPDFLREGDVVVLNNTRVFPARLFGRSETGARVEIFLVRETSRGMWETLARPARRLKTGKKIIFSKKLIAEVIDKTEDGRVRVRFEADGDFDGILDEIGRTPLPPYIKREEDAIDADRERYQTVFARERGAIAAPTAGLHFTPEILEKIRAMGVTIAEVTLHVGYGTFEPVRVRELSRHSVMPEQYEISAETAETLNRAKAEGRRIVAIGTTTTRALETVMTKHGRFEAERESANLTILPGYKFKAIDALLTNFHLPQSSLLVLVSTFAGHQLIMDAYNHAVSKSYRFYSYGDCMLII